MHHFGGAADAYADVIETDDAIAVVGFEIHAYDAVVVAANKKCLDISTFFKKLVIPLFLHLFEFLFS